MGNLHTKFMEDVFELAFGEGAIDKHYTPDEVLAKLREFSDDALKVTHPEEAGVPDYKGLLATAVPLIDRIDCNDQNDDWELEINEFVYELVDAGLLEAVNHE